MVTGVPAPVLEDEDGNTCTTSGAVAVDGVGNALGLIVSTRGSAGSGLVAKISAYWPVDVLPAPIAAVWEPLVVTVPRMLSRWPQHPLSVGWVQSRLVPP